MWQGRGRMLGERPTENATGRRAASSGAGASLPPTAGPKNRAGVNLPWLRRRGAGAGSPARDEPGALAGAVGRLASGSRRRRSPYHFEDEP